MNVVILISGSGTNLQALIDATQPSHSLNGLCNIQCVISNRAAAYGLTRAKNANIPTKVFSLGTAKKAGKTREQYDLELVDLIRSYSPDLVVLAGFMHILSADFIDRLATPVINLHPALPGQFDGAHAIERAYDAFKAGKITHTGVMVHWVTKIVDGGEPIMTKKIDVLPEDTLESLEERIHSVEHVIIVEATKKVLLGLQAKDLLKTVT